MSDTTEENADNDRGDAPAELLWSLKTVVRKTGLSSASIYRYMACGRFPAQRQLGPNRVAWLASEVAAWSGTRPHPKT